MEFKIRKSAAIGTLFFLLFVQGAFASERKCKTGEITEAHGETLRESPLQAKVEHLKSGLCVSDGQALITRKNAGLGVALSGGSNLNIAGESEVLVGFPIGGKPTKLNITRGEIKVKSPSNNGPIVNLLRLTVTEKTAGTTVLAEVFHDGQEAWLVVTHGSAIARLGNEAPGLVVDAGHSVYVTESQKETPRVVRLDEREMEALSQDHAFQKTISQLLMVEAGAEAKPDSAIDSDQDVTLEQYAAQEKARKLPAPPAPPVVTNLPLIPMPHETPRPRPVSLPERPETPSAQIGVASVPQPAKTPVSEGKAVVKEQSDFLPSYRLDVGPSFYSDAVGFEIGAQYLVPLTHLFSSLNDYNGTDGWSLGGGLGYSHAAKDQLTVANWKFTVIINDRLELSKAVSVLPEFSLGAAIENVSLPAQSFGHGAAFYYSPDLLFELNLERSPHCHPGLAFVAQEYMGSTNLFSTALEFSLRFDL